ncbi:hypothetical protein PR003_g7640 [Phytophthora rubi]|uniref:Integrase catalytic domain-containing protein n=1 Tax=Phytophthora rubi TaxID=129364 RepID=A0A6A4FZN8_9STRA|nr:hypothetical protein PR003_g7640 [Phytophthora rubi]
MELIELQQKMIRESMTDAAIDEAREQQLDEVRWLAVEVEELKQQDAEDEPQDRTGNTDPLASGGAARSTPPGIAAAHESHTASQKMATSTMMQTGQLESVPSPRKKPTAQRPTPDPQPQPTTPVKTHKPQQPTEPEPTPPSPAQAAVPSEAQKLPKLKDIHCRRFDGKEYTQDWASVLGTFLEGQASRSYHDFAGDRDVSYEELIAHLKKEFGCNLSQYELGKRLDTNKRAGDTWKQYVTYLKFFERLMAGDQSQLLLETVCNNACPELKSTLLSVVLFAHSSSGANKRKATTRSSEQGGSQQGGDQQQQWPNNQRQGQQRNSASANAAEKTLTCWNSSETGHRQAQCTSPKKSTQQASACQAQQQNKTPDSESEDDGMSELWMASSVTSAPTEATSTCLDTGASHHMCSSAAVLFGTSPSKLVIKVANEAKQTKSQQPTTDISESAPTDEIGAVLGVDLTTDILPADRNGNAHMLTIADYGSSYNRVYLLQTKDEAPKRLMDFLPEFERQYGVPVKVIRSDGGGEFLGRELFKAYCTRHGWKAAIEKELRDQQANGTWEVVTMPPDANIVSSKWVFRIKFNSRGELERFKARLVARKFSQRYGIDFVEAYSPVLKTTSVRFLAALAA